MIRTMLHLLIILKILLLCEPRITPITARPFTATMIVPTGVAARVGGYAGDALPAAKLLASVCDVLITHPNVLNGAMLYWPVDNILYVEGHSLDEFAAGRITLRPLEKNSQKIGIIFDKGIEESLLIRHLQVIDACRATLGIDICHCVVTTRPLNIRTALSRSGASWGSIDNTNCLVSAGELLRDKYKATAIGIIARFPEDDEIEDTAASERFDAYRKGSGVDAIAGVEALISHIISHRLLLPCAHAPAFSPADIDRNVSPKACAEELGYTFLPCILAYLHRAPTIVPQNLSSKLIDSSLICSDDVDAVVVPINALGGPAVLSFMSRGVPVIAVEDNLTTMEVCNPGHGKIFRVKNYIEAAGLLAALKAGIFVDSLSGHVSPISVDYMN